MKTENKIIAEFLGAREYKDTYDMYGIIDTVQDGEWEKHYYEPKEMLFHKSWDWLMIVVDKIQDIRVQPDDDYVSNHRFNVQIWVSQCSITDITTDKIVGEGDYGTKLESTYHAVIEFIKWWSKEQTKLSSEQIADFILSDIPAYKEAIRDCIIKRFEQNKHIRNYWDAWFRGAQGKDLEDAERGIKFNS